MDGTQNVDKKLKDAYAELGESVCRVRRLEAENSALRAQLDALLQANNDHVDGGNPDPNHEHGTNHPSGPQGVTAEQFDALGRQYAQLQASFSKLQSQHSGCQRRIDEALQKARDHKNAAKEWKAYSERKGREKNQPMTGSSVRIAAADGTSTVELSRGDHNTETTPPCPTFHFTSRPLGEAGDTSSELPSSPPRITNRTTDADGQAPRQPHAHISRVTSSQSTVEDVQRQAGPDLPVKSRLNSDSEPIVISSRSLKRKAGISAAAEPSARRIKQEPNFENSIIELNSEPFLDQRKTPERSGRMAHSDLDTTGAVVVTPHRPRRVKDLHQRATSEEVARSAPQLNRAQSSISDGGVAAHGEQSLTPTLIKVEPDDTSHRNQDTRHTDRSSHRFTFTNGHDHNILRPISGNVSNLGRSNDLPTNTKPRAKTRESRGHVALLSEDGDDGSCQVNALLPLAKRSALPSAEMDDTLEKMLNEPSPVRPPAPPTVPKTLASKPRPAAATSHLITPVSAVKRVSPVKQPNVHKIPRAPPESPPPVRPEDEPLRLRDVKGLRLQDFKINPKYMGTDFAFADTLRGRDQRRTLHTCDKPDCCGGALQKVIAMGGASLSGKTDAQALETYMGPNWRSMAKAHGPEKERQFTLQAHAHCFAAQHGKHRQAFVRRSTPPGFWRTDFPTTQEAESDREKARELERDAVEQRYREAMREGGRWIFRDE